MAQRSSAAGSPFTMTGTPLVSRTGQRTVAGSQPDAQDPTRRVAGRLPIRCELGDRQRARSADGSRRHGRSQARVRETNNPRSDYGTGLVCWLWTRAPLLGAKHTPARWIMRGYEGGRLDGRTGFKVETKTRPAFALPHLRMFAPPLPEPPSWRKI